MANRCERCGDRYYEECITCRDAIRALSRACGSESGASAVMEWIKSVVAETTRAAAVGGEGGGNEQPEREA